MAKDHKCTLNDISYIMHARCNRIITMSQVVKTQLRLSWDSNPGPLVYHAQPSNHWAMETWYSACRLTCTPAYPEPTCKMICVKCHLSCILYLLMSASRNNDVMCIRATFLHLLQDNTLVLMLLLPFAGTFRHKRCCLCERWGRWKWDAW